jgi:ATP-binding protein involved in chromosome partitioning
MESQSCGINNQQDQHAIQDADIKERLSHIKKKILVMSGKGGVGKSTVAAYLSVCLANKGYKVGLMDVDLHGPSRGPLKIGVIRQFISDIEWPDLDFLIIDSPPGTGDEPLTVAQTIQDARALIVTTPQEISLADVRKSINFCRQVGMFILGLVENMSGLICPHCGEKIDLFKSNGGQLTATKENIPLLASLPIEPEVVCQGDLGNLANLDHDKFAFCREFDQMVEKIVKKTYM